MMLRRMEGYRGIDGLLSRRSVWFNWADAFVREIAPSVKLTKAEEKMRREEDEWRMEDVHVQNSGLPAVSSLCVW